MEIQLSYIISIVSISIISILIVFAKKFIINWLSIKRISKVPLEPPPMPFKLPLIYNDFWAKEIFKDAFVKVTHVTQISI